MQWELRDQTTNILAESKSKTFKLRELSYWFLSNFSENGPYEYNFISANFKQQCERSGSIIPAGNYRITYKLFKTVEGCNWVGEFLQKWEFPLNLFYYTHIDLISPFNGDSIFAINPVFQWTPAQPQIFARNSLNYSFKLVELMFEQNPQQALMYNPSYYEQEIKETRLMYPVYAKKLEEGKYYAWRVELYNENRIVAQSPVWVFKVISANPEAIKAKEGNFYYTMQDLPDMANWINIGEDFLYFGISAEKNEEKQVNYELLNADDYNKVIISGKKHPLSQRFGMNLYSLPINNLKNNNKYTLVVKTENSQTYYLNFIKQNTIAK